MTQLAIPRKDWTENYWDGRLFRAKNALAKTLGWQSYHTLRSKGSKAGYPDRTCWRDRVIFVELKSEKGLISELQRLMLDQLARAGGECYVWRPSHEDEIARILSKPWTFVNWQETGGYPHLQTSFGVPWTPSSLWIPA